MPQVFLLIVFLFFVLVSNKFSKDRLSFFVSLIFFLGGLCNTVVVWSNGGKMPVKVTSEEIKLYLEMEAENDGRHCSMTNETKFNWLADIFDVSDLVGVAVFIFSIGDVLLVGSALFILLRFFCRLFIWAIKKPLT